MLTPLLEDALGKLPEMAFHKGLRWWQVRIFTIVSGKSIIWKESLKAAVPKGLQLRIQKFWGAKVANMICG